MSAASASSFRLPIPSCHTAARFWCGPIYCKHMRCCLMPTGMDSASSKASLGAASIGILQQLADSKVGPTKKAQLDSQSSRED
jgi:hypothetical protein